MLDIEEKDIAKLNDADFRNLIGLLCEADYRREQLPTNGITWGGHQDAPDGGVDVRINHIGKQAKQAFIQGGQVIIQVKSYDMPKQAIHDEMRPEGILREPIKQLAPQKGSYIIICNTENLTDLRLRNRLLAMQEAIGELVDQVNLNFLDGNRVASWVRSHPSMIIWVREKIGRPLHGWYPFNNWSFPSVGKEDEYLLDENSKFWDRTHNEGIQMDILSGIHRLREVLSHPGTSRLIGLSGVGKTRFAQTLFDDRLGQNALPSSEVIYCDINDEPVPSPRGMVEELINEDYGGVLIVDNCNPQTHRSLSNCCYGKSKLKLLTIEYDVSDFDIPEETNVFELDNSDESLIISLIQNRYPSINFGGAQIIAEHSNGNSRVALALANELKSERSISSLSSKDLFRRLFYQRGKEDQEMLKVGWVCSLVYSFQGKDYQSDNSEISFLSSLIDKTPTNFYFEVNKIKKRQLMQSRSEWRALLPHAIANRLAIEAIEFFGANRIFSVFNENTPQRLLRSFTRRMQYLHESLIVKDIVQRWFLPGGRFDDLTSLNDFELESFFNIAAICPEYAAEKLEQLDKANGFYSFLSSSSNTYKSYDWAEMLAFLAYDEAQFLKCTRLLSKVIIYQRERYKNEKDLPSIEQLFQIVGSGTKAPISCRIKIIEELIDSKEQYGPWLGLKLLAQALQTEHLFGPPSRNHISKAIRDQGWKPETQEEYNAWFICVCELIMSRINSEEIKYDLRGTFSEAIPVLLQIKGIEDQIISWIKQLHQDEFWVDGWSKVMRIVHLYGKDMDKEDHEKIDLLEKFMQPKNREEEIRAYVLSPEHKAIDLFPSTEQSGKRRRDIDSMAKIKAIKLGQNNANNRSLLKILKNDLIGSRGSYIYDFGQGLFEGTTDRISLWNWLKKAYCLHDPKKRNNNVIIGFLSSWAKADRTGFDIIIDSFIEHPHFGQNFLNYQLIVNIGKPELSRLHQYLESSVCQVQTFNILSYGRRHEAISDTDLSKLLKSIMKFTEGHKVVIDILNMRFHSNRNANEELSSVGREAILKVNFTKVKYNGRPNKNDIDDIVDVCFLGDDARMHAIKAFSLLNSSDIYGSWPHKHTITNLAIRYPNEFLDEFLGDSTYVTSKFKWSVSGKNIEKNPFIAIGNEELIEWAQGDINRLSRALRCLPPYERIDGTLQWHPSILILLEQEKDIDQILNIIKNSLYPISWSNSFAEFHADIKPLLNELAFYPDKTISTWAKSELEELTNKIEHGKKLDSWLYRREAQSFE